MPKITIEVNDRMLEIINKTMEESSFSDYQDYIMHCIRKDIDHRSKIESLRRELAILEHDLNETD